MFTFKSARYSKVWGAAAALAVTGAAWAAPITPGDLVMMRVTNGLGAEQVFLDEFNVSGAAPVLVQTIALPTSGVDKLSEPGLTNHDRQVHLSGDGHVLTFAGYAAAFGGSDPSLTTVPRVVGVVYPDGSVNLSTKLSTAFSETTMRAAVSSDGNSIWVAGDNSGAAPTNGGLRYTTLGSSTTVNLSQVQVTGGAKTPDNVRDVSIFGGQLYDASGSSSSIGKAVFKVGTGLPTTGSQTLTTLTTDGASVSSFYFIDADAGVPGVDTLYTATSTGPTLRKYILSGGSWIPKGTIAGVADFEQVAVMLSGGVATIFAETGGSVYKITDATPYTGSIGGALPAAYILPTTAAGAGYTLGGYDFAPVPEPASLSLLGLGAAALLSRRARKRS